MDVKFSQSTDSDCSWSTPVTVIDNADAGVPAEQFQPSVAAAPTARSPSLSTAGADADCSVGFMGDYFGLAVSGGKSTHCLSRRTIDLV
jgi:hypothetical protein